MSRLKFQYNSSIKTNYDYGDSVADNLKKVIALMIRKNLDSKATVNKDNKVTFETHFLNTRFFDLNVSLFSNAIDSGYINIVDNKGKIRLDFNVSYLRGLLTLYLLDFLGITISVLYFNQPLFSWTMLGLIFIPIVIMFPVFILGLRSFIVTIEESLKKRKMPIREK